MIILIPAYEPDEHLVRLIRTIGNESSGQIVVLVDDGSGPGYASVFETCRALGCDVIDHPINRGKGYALKRGFAHIAGRYPGHDVVCADCDGQHTLTDISRVGDALRRHPSGIVLGARQFVGAVPARSKFGNDMTRRVFTMVTGVRLQDTQTGLRGYPGSMLGWLQTLDGEHFEYELEVLLAAERTGVVIHEVPIETIYLAGNATSHFRPIRDSVRVYLPFLKFSMSSLAAFGIDATLFFGLMATTGHLAASVVGARVVSASVNYVTNRQLVFGGQTQRHPRSAVGYGALVAGLTVTNYLLLRTLTGALGFGVVPAKLATEIALFAVSYQVQRRLVFRRGATVAPVATPDVIPTVETRAPEAAISR